MSSLRAETERWFIRRGVPHLIDDYSAGTDIWTRARPFLIGVLLLQTMLAFNDRFTGLAQGGVFLGATILMLLAVAIFNRWRGRRLFDVPAEVDWPELMFFVLAPAALALVVSGQPLRDALVAAASNLVVLGITYIIVGYALLPMVRWATVKLFEHLRDLTRLVARTLPVLLVLTVFMFINAEIWQVAYAVEPPGFALVASAIIVVGLTFLWASTSQILDTVGDVTTWDESRRLASDSPLANLELTSDQLAAQSQPVASAGLTIGGRFNLRILMMVSLAVQVILVGLLVAGFYVVLGLILVNPEVLGQWTATDDLHSLYSTSLGSIDITLTREHLRVSGLIGVLAGLNVAVSALTDDVYRQAFTSDLVAEVEENLAVRRLYRQLPDETQLPA